MSKIHFLTFAAGPDFRHSLTAIAEEASSFSLFDEIHAWNEKDCDPEFWEEHRTFIESNPRGYGYWLWKPYINLKLLSQVEEGDIIVYADGGCQLNNTPSSQARLKEYVELARTSPHGMVSFSLRYFPDTRFTKMDTAVALHATEYMETKQLVGGIFVMRKCGGTISLFENFYEACKKDNYHLITDTPSIVPNASDFQEHRHDQSVFSLLRKQRGTTMIRDETYWGPDWNENGKDYPIWARRRRITL